ncbi:MAG: DUF1343 domain-containing protein, partial [candidate division WOR-3 bacterium]
LGIDNVVNRRFKMFKGARIGLCSNMSCCSVDFTPTIYHFLNQKTLRLTHLFAPEHGLNAALQDQVRSSDDIYARAGVSIKSLYDKTYRPKLRMLKDLDMIVIDLQDIGTRYYTFVWTALVMIEQAAQYKKKVFVLDRPNPLNGTSTEGPVLEPDFKSFVGLHPIPVRHGMTIGELCTLMNDELRLGAELEIVPMSGWRRKYYFPDTELFWSAPSPNMPSFHTALVYPGMCLLEGTNISEGRGTTRPFTLFGAPWIESLDLVRALRKKDIPGTAFRPLSFQPTFHKYRGTMCGGAEILVTKRNQFKPTFTGLEIIRTIKHMYGKHFRWLDPPYEYETEKMPFDILIGNPWVREGITRHQTITKLQDRWHTPLQRFIRKRKKYLLYN